MKNIAKYTAVAMLLGGFISLQILQATAQETTMATGTQISENTPVLGGDPVRGASLYEKCASCHTYTGKGIAGLPEEKLLQRMQFYQKGNFVSESLQKMQKVLKPMSEQDLFDLAAYITKM